MSAFASDEIDSSSGSSVSKDAAVAKLEDDNDDGDEVEAEAEAEDEEEGGKTSSVPTESAPTMIDFTSPNIVLYCPIDSLPAEYCEYGPCFEQCLPWIMENCPEVLSEKELAKMMGEVSIAGEGEEVYLSHTFEKKC